MTKLKTIEDILAIYKKHGWNLRRVLLSAELRSSLEKERPTAEIFGNAEILEAEINAAWFSRPSKNKNIAWELRHLSENPFALFELFHEDNEESENESIRKQLETRLKNLASNKQRQN